METTPHNADCEETHCKNYFISVGISYFFCETFDETMLNSLQEWHFTVLVHVTLKLEKHIFTSPNNLLKHCFAMKVYSILNSTL
jgi:hypothetical protein